MRENENIKDFAERAIDGFEVKPYNEVDEILRKGAKKAIDRYKKSVTETLDYVGELAI